jgi:hypothetical protein
MVLHDSLLHMKLTPKLSSRHEKHHKSHDTVLIWSVSMLLIPHDVTSFSHFLWPLQNPTAPDKTISFAEIVPN